MNTLGCVMQPGVWACLQQLVGCRNCCAHLTLHLEKALELAALTWSAVFCIASTFMHVKQLPVYCVPCLSHRACTHARPYSVLFGVPWPG
jgi:hypothetical protein